MDTSLETKTAMHMGILFIRLFYPRTRTLEINMYLSNINFEELQQSAYTDKIVLNFCGSSPLTAG